jgi:hypothetical protein
MLRHLINADNRQLEILVQNDTVNLGAIFGTLHCD